MMTDEIVNEMLPTAASFSASDIRIGLGYTGVHLDSGGCGLAYTFHENEAESCCVVAEAGKLAGKRGSELIPLMKQTEPTLCAVGLATVNAMVKPPSGVVESDILDLLAVRTDDAVGMIGYFGPLVNPLKERVRALHIFERKADIGMGVLPESETRNLLPFCQVVVMTATTILNHTIDPLLDLCKTAREIAILGPSTPFLPGIFARRGITLLSGLQVVDAPQALRIVSEGGGTRQFGKSVRKLTLRVKNLAR
jgi:uncharacterized protein (DUF4213/DUF364 family)